jgi:hypothetical protein
VGWWRSRNEERKQQQERTSPKNLARGKKSRTAKANMEQANRRVGETMSRCIRAGTEYKRHSFKPKFSHLPGICEHCGQMKGQQGVICDEQRDLESPEEMGSTTGDVGGVHEVSTGLGCLSVSAGCDGPFDDTPGNSGEATGN